MAAERALLELKSVVMRYDSVQSAEHLEILRGVTLEVRRGESVAIVGPSGSGKSTLLNIIGTLDKPVSGEVLLDGKDLTRLDEKQLAHVRNHQIGFVFQAHHLLPQCTVLENVLVPTLADKTGQAGAEERGRKLLHRVGLTERINHRPGQISGGERQRAAVVRALIMKPQLLLADEPTGALDRNTSNELSQLLVELNREENVTLIVVTHSPDLATRMGRVLELREGKLVQQ
ncbi:MAG: transporter related protein [Verrucomicrobiales bacterium]|nr:transporter related protein [Verrucomicrobiales bacterium]